MPHVRNDATDEIEAFFREGHDKKTILAIAAGRYLARGAAAHHGDTFKEARKGRAKGFRRIALREEDEELREIGLVYEPGELGDGDLG